MRLLWPGTAAFIISFSTFAAGLDAGSNLPGYNPKHLTGADKGTKECPS